MSLRAARSNARNYYHFDGVGSVIALSNVNGEIVERYSYDVFGEPNRTSDVNNPYLFTARRYDEESGLYYYRARYYAYDIGRFLQTDPIGYDDGLNVYLYAWNNPLNRIDPAGLSSDFAGFRRGVSFLADQYDRLKILERDWIEKHGSIAGFNAMMIQANALVKTRERFNLKSISEIKDPSDMNAYLHAYFSASMTRTHGIVAAKEFLDAHENIIPGLTCSYLLHRGTIMDLYNNMVGRALATAYYNQGKTTTEIINEALEQGLLISSLDDPRIEKYRHHFTGIGKRCP